MNFNFIESKILIKNEIAKKEETNEEIVNTEKEKIEKEPTVEQENKEYIPDKKWQIEIPIISLVAPISEGTYPNVLNQYVGHFENTQILEGNIGLAAHNRGYPVNYFSKLKSLKIGDEIIYILGENVKTYTVVKNIEISDIDWSHLENTDENKITLITCIENKPEYRRCVQGIEKIKE